MERRKFLQVTATGLGALGSSTLWGAPLLAQAKHKHRAVLFDAFPIFDPRPVFALVEELFPGKGAEFSATWRTRQFEYQWLRAVSHKYQDFWHITEDALVFTAKHLHLELTPEKHDRLLNAYLLLKAYPDVAPALHQLKEAGVRLGFLSNMTSQMLTACIKSSSLEGLFTDLISTESAKTFKPDPKAYQLGVSRLGLKREAILFAAFASWDLAGAKWFGYPTYWVNRQKVTNEELGMTPDGTGESLTELAQFVLA